LAYKPFVIVADPDIIKDLLILKNLPKHSLMYADVGYIYGQR